MANNPWAWATPFIELNNTLHRAGLSYLQAMGMPPVHFMMLMNAIQDYKGDIAELVRNFVNENRETIPYWWEEEESKRALGSEGFKFLLENNGKHVITLGHSPFWYVEQAKAYAEASPIRMTLDVTNISFSGNVYTNDPIDGHERSYYLTKNPPKGKRLKNYLAYLETQGASVEAIIARAQNGQKTVLCDVHETGSALYSFFSILYYDAKKKGLLDDFIQSMEICAFTSGTRDSIGEFVFYHDGKDVKIPRRFHGLGNAGRLLGMATTDKRAAFMNEPENAGRAIPSYHVDNWAESHPPKQLPETESVGKIRSIIATNASQMRDPTPKRRRKKGPAADR